MEDPRDNMMPVEVIIIDALRIATVKLMNILFNMFPSVFLISSFWPCYSAFENSSQLPQLIFKTYNVVASPWCNELQKFCLLKGKQVGLTCFSFFLTTLWLSLLTGVFSILIRGDKIPSLIVYKQSDLSSSS